MKIFNLLINRDHLTHFDIYLLLDVIVELLSLLNKIIIK
jgi:hypothetical protein